PASRPGPPTILWNHRWEFDKAPEVFFEALFRLQADRLRFKLIVCGETHQIKPKIFLEAKRRLRRRWVHFGFEPSRARYARWVSESDIAVSTAIQENFGLSVVEAMYAGCYPLLPRRLSYPEILPAEFHAGHLYDGPEDLCARLRTLLREGLPTTFDPERLRRRVAVYDWRAMARRYDDLFDQCGRRAL
ncbi:MAG: glycosyltransferase, partial [Nitrospinota bacterium]|nr:glycosyltransferase [Nitrospinota bacterium]